MNTHCEIELFNPINLCNDNNLLNEKSIGWSRFPIINCNLKHHILRKKKWNYWLAISNECLFSATISNIDYLGLVFIYMYDFNTGNFIEKTIITPLGRGCTMPIRVNDSVIFTNNKIKVSFINNNNNTRILVECSHFGDNYIKVDLVAYRLENLESLNVVIPWSKKRFQFTSKQNCLPIKGTILYNNKIYNFSKERDFASLDFGRGIWKYNTMWNWATCSGIYSNKTIGINLGGTWTDNTGITENAIYVDNILYKIYKEVIFIYDPQNLMKPWTIKTKYSNDIILQFYPIFKRVAKTNALIINSKVNQIIGEFCGTINLDNSNTIYFENLKGCAEEHYAKW
ncbi:DUF2804 domain-containing protein [Clostridium sp. DL1XJH146]